MNITNYCKKRKLEMVEESDSLSKRRNELIIVYKRAEAELSQVNKLIERLEIELEVLNKVHKGVIEC